MKRWRYGFAGVGLAVLLLMQLYVTLRWLVMAGLVVLIGSVLLSCSVGDAPMISPCAVEPVEGELDSDASVNAWGNRLVPCYALGGRWGGAV